MSLVRQSVASRLPLASARRDEMETAVSAAVRERNLALACKIASDFQDALGIPEDPCFPTKPNLADVTGVFNVRPKTLSGVGEDVLGNLRVAAAMAFLLCPILRVSNCTRWLRQNLDTGIRLSGPAAVNMIISGVQSGRNLASWRSSGLVRTVRITCSADGPCETCAKLKDRIWPIAEVPEIPYEHCTTSQGCRCCYIAGEIVG